MIDISDHPGSPFDESEPTWRSYQAPRRRGRGFERFVAAIQSLSERSGDVRWDERINGRQFDVTIRTSTDGATVLTVIECRDLSSRVAVEAVEAFVTKAKDAGADRAVIVSSSGFTRSAVDAATRHGVELRVVKEVIEDAPSRTTRKQGEALNIRRIRFFDPDGKIHQFRLDDPQMRDAIIRIPGREFSVDQFTTMFQLEIITRLRDCGGAEEFEHSFPSGSELAAPGESSRPISRIAFIAELITATIVTRHAPPVNLRRIRRYEISTPGSTDILSIAANDLIIGPNTQLTPGKFYRDVLGMTFKCLSIKAKTVTMMQLDLRSGPRGIAAVTFTMDTSYRNRYAEIEDAVLCGRLEGLCLRVTVPPMTPSGE